MISRIRLLPQNSLTSGCVGLRPVLLAAGLLVLVAAPMGGNALYIDMGERNMDAREQLLQRYRALNAPRFELYNTFHRVMGSQYPDGAHQQPPVEGEQQHEQQEGGEQEATGENRVLGNEWLPDQMPGFSTFSGSPLTSPAESSGRIHAVRRAYRPKQNMQDVINISFPKHTGWPRLVKRG